MTVQITGLRTTVDPHWRRGLSYLKIGLCYLSGVINKEQTLLAPIPLFSKDPEPCFASKKAQLDFYDSIWFLRSLLLLVKSDFFPSIKDVSGSQISLGESGTA